MDTDTPTDFFFGDVKIDALGVFKVHELGFAKDGAGAVGGVVIVFLLGAVGEVCTWELVCVFVLNLNIIDQRSLILIIHILLLLPRFLMNKHNIFRLNVPVSYSLRLQQHQSIQHPFPKHHQLLFAELRH